MLEGGSERELEKRLFSLVDARLTARLCCVTESKVVFPLFWCEKLSQLHVDAEPQQTIGSLRTVIADEATTQRSL